MSTGPTPLTPTPAAPNPLHQALDWAKQKSVDLLHALNGIAISKPAAEVAAVAEAAFAAVLPAALAAEEQAVAAYVAESAYPALDALIGAINAAVVKQWLAAIPATPPVGVTTIPKAP